MESNNNILPGVSSLIRQSLAFYKKNYKSFVSIGLVLVIINIIGAILGQFSSLENNKILVAIFLILTFTVSIIGGVMQVVNQIALIKATKEHDSGLLMSTKDIYRFSFKLFFPMLWISILASLLTIGTGILLIIPGIILVGYISFVVYALVLDNKKGLNAVSTSFYYMRGNWWKVFWRYLGFGLIILLLIAVLACLALLILKISGIPLSSLFSRGSEGIVGTYLNKVNFDNSNIYIYILLLSSIFNFISYCIVYPISTIYGYIIYKNIKMTKPEPNQEIDLKRIRKWFVALSIWGIVSVLIIIVIPLVFGFISGYKNAKNRIPNTPSPIVFSKKENDLLLNPLNQSYLESKEYINNEFGFSIRVPKDWEIEISKNKLDGIILSSKDENIGAVIQIQRYDESINKEFIDELANEIISDKSIFKNPVFSITNIGSNIAYKIDQSLDTDKISAGIKNYIIGTKFPRVYLVSLGWNTEKDSRIPSIMLDSVSTFRSI